MVTIASGPNRAHYINGSTFVAHFYGQVLKTLGSSLVIGRGIPMADKLATGGFPNTSMA